jgi:hypothetical protein
MIYRRGLLAACFILGTASCDKLTGPLSPARKLEGTWKTALPVTFYYQTDFCGGSTENVATAQWNVTWIVTAQEGYDNVLDIEMHFDRSGSTPITSSSCGSDANGWVPLVSPTFLEATLSSTDITAYDEASGIHAFGAFTSDLMSVTWVHHECIIYCTGEVTATNELKLVRQR